MISGFCHKVAENRTLLGYYVVWKEYFDKLLNTEEPRELIKKGNKEISEVEVEKLTTEDVKRQYET